MNHFQYIADVKGQFLVSITGIPEYKVFAVRIS